MYYPNEHLIRFISDWNRHIKERGSIRILDHGCGSCNNTIYLARKGFMVYGLDISEEAIKIGKTDLKASRINCDLRVGEMCTCNYTDSFFNMIIDIQTIQHNVFKDIKKTIDEFKRVLIKGGIFFGMMVSVEDHSFKKGRLIEPGTLTEIVDSTFSIVGHGITHFFSLSELKTLFDGWSYLKIEEAMYTRKSMTEKIVYYLVEAEK
ncbi:type 11 methyltransferase [Candidatus Magnetobacterium bavaricum]|uniref:Type 11 methyltransferase n=1 Tax=Candidatus Magnetobacterium bavaricum TaxID=29290 RepID=A0A0F3GMZ0_9BACT|nr:type 11 methyltransferase [Candidatus Magnetobacterium bavaricum]